MKSLLIVIEEEYLSKGITLALMNDFQTIHSTKNPYEALEILRRERINVIISDSTFSTISQNKYLYDLNSNSKSAELIIILQQQKEIPTEYISNNKFTFKQKPISIINILETLKSNSQTKNSYKRNDL